MYCIKSISHPKNMFIQNNSSCQDSEWLKFEARIHCKVRLRPKKLQTSRCQCSHRRGRHYLDKTRHDKTKESRASDSL